MIQRMLGPRKWRETERVALRDAWWLLTQFAYGNLWPTCYYFGGLLFFAIPKSINWEACPLYKRPCRENCQIKYSISMFHEIFGYKRVYSKKNSSSFIWNLNLIGHPIFWFRFILLLLNLTALSVGKIHSRFVSFFFLIVFPPLGETRH